ncbi:MAG: hypothetical protein ABEI96_09390 [Haloarculaceae archaeon]
MATVKAQFEATQGPCPSAAERRSFLRAGPVAGALALAGCVGDGPETAETTDEFSTDASPTSETTGEAVPTITDRSFTLLEGGCGQRIDEATITFGERRVDIEGTIWGSDTCKRVRLQAATYDSETGRLTVAVETYTHTEDGETLACAQCIVELDYRATVAFDGGLPAEVEVRHRGEHVTTVLRPDS